MESLDILEKQYEISYMEFVNDMQLIHDNEEIACTYYAEDGSNDQSFFGKIKEKFKKLFEALQKFFRNLFTDKRAEEQVKKLEAMKREELEKAKIKVLDVHKMMAHSKKYRQKIMNAKSEEELEKIMKEYQAGRKKLLAGAAITTVGGLAVLSFWKNKQFKKYDAEAQRAYDEYMVAIQDLGYTQNRAKSHHATAQDMVEKAADTLHAQENYAEANIRAQNASWKARDRAYNTNYFTLRQKCNDLMKMGSDIFDDIKVASDWIVPWAKGTKFENDPDFQMSYYIASLNRTIEKYPTKKDKSNKK